MEAPRGKGGRIGKVDEAEAVAGPGGKVGAYGGKIEEVEGKAGPVGQKAEEDMGLGKLEDVAGWNEGEKNGVAETEGAGEAGTKAGATGGGGQLEPPERENRHVTKCTSAYCVVNNTQTSLQFVLKCIKTKSMILI